MKFLFDCDDTLYDLERPFYQAVQDLDLPLHQEQILFIHRIENMEMRSSIKYSPKK